MDLMALLIQIVVGVIILAPVLWIAGRLLAGKDKARFIDAIWIVILGVVLGAVVGFFVNGIVAAIIMFVIWLGLIKHFFDCGWLKAFAIAIIAVLIFIVIVVVIALIFGIALVGLIGLAL